MSYILKNIARGRVSNISFKVIPLYSNYRKEVISKKLNRVSENKIYVFEPFL